MPILPKAAAILILDLLTWNGLQQSTQPTHWASRLTVRLAHSIHGAHTSQECTHAHTPSTIAFSCCTAAPDPKRRRPHQRERRREQTNSSRDLSVAIRCDPSPCRADLHRISLRSRALCRALDPLDLARDDGPRVGGHRRPRHGRHPREASELLGGAPRLLDEL